MHTSSKTIHLPDTHAAGKSVFTILRMLAVTLMLAEAMFAAAGGSGTVTGRVMNARSGEYLENARITVEGTDLQALTDNLGRYTLANVPVGTARLRAFHTGGCRSKACRSLSAEIKPFNSTSNCRVSGLDQRASGIR